MRNKTLFLAVTLGGLGLSPHAWSADHSKITLLLDNDKVTVLHMIEPAGNHQEVNSDDHLVIPLNTFRTTETRNGKTETLVRERGKAYWREGGPRSYVMMNRADMLIIDLKPGKASTFK